MYIYNIEVWTRSILNYGWVEFPLAYTQVSCIIKNKKNQTMSECIFIWQIRSPLDPLAVADFTLLIQKNKKFEFYDKLRFSNLYISLQPNVVDLW